MDSKEYIMRKKWPIVRYHTCPTKLSDLQSPRPKYRSLKNLQKIILPEILTGNKNTPINKIDIDRYVKVLDYLRSIDPVIP